MLAASHQPFFSKIPNGVLSHRDKLLKHKALLNIKTLNEQRLMSLKKHPASFRDWSHADYSTTSLSSLAVAGYTTTTLYPFQVKVV